MAYYVTTMISTEGPDGDPNFFSDYITNPAKRYMDWSAPALPANFWTNYSAVYLNYRDNDKIIFRSKHVDANNDMFVTQVWESQAVREQFLIDVDHATFESNKSFSIERNDYEANTSVIESLIDSVIDSGDYIIQICLPEFQRSGMVIGDPLKGDTLVTVE
jgi:hypothetical protein